MDKMNIGGLADEWMDGQTDRKPLAEINFKKWFHASELFCKPHHKRETWLAHRQKTAHVCKTKFAFLKVAIMEIVNFPARQLARSEPTLHTLVQQALCNS